MKADRTEDHGELTEPGDPGADAGSVDAPLPSVADVQALIEERDRLVAENRSLQDQLLRRLAEFDNFRKRTAREQQEAREYGAMNAVRELLPVLDGLERASQTVPGEADELHEGVRLIARQMLEILGRLGLRPIGAVGLPFDPELHQAVDRVITDEYEDHTVIEEWQRGYMFKDKLLRPAMVKVAVAPNHASE